MSSVLRTELVDGVSVVSLNRPAKHNALDDALQEALWAAVADAIDDDSVRAVLLRGEGPSFSSGRDTTALGHHGDRGLYAFAGQVQEAAVRLVTCPKPVVAALKGHVLGVGLEIALSADIRVIARGTSIGFPEVNHGLSTDNGGAGLATVLAGPSRAKHLLMTGETIDADQAVAWGLADWLVDPDQLDERALEIARRLASRPPLAVRMFKHLVDQVHRGRVLDELRAELPVLMALYASDDVAEARSARAEGRPPVYRGR